MLYILGFLAFCYLFGGRAGFAAFWYFTRWPAVVIFALATFLNIPIYGLDPFLLLIIFGILALVDLDKVPDWIWDMINLIVYLLLLVVFGYFLVEIGVLK